MDRMDSLAGITTHAVPDLAHPTSSASGRVGWPDHRHLRHPVGLRSFQAGLLSAHDPAIDTRLAARPPTVYEMLGLLVGKHQVIAID
jgi:hypothetical protein